MAMADFQRTKEVETLLSFIGNGKVNIVAGLRRAGKTYLLDTVFVNKIINELKTYVEKDIGILYLDSVDKDIRTEVQLDSALANLAKNNKKIIIIDEVQLATGFVNSLKAFVKMHPEIAVFVTGSNSDILSKQIITMFQGSAETLIINPLTYKEIIEEIPDYPIDTYIAYGGLPYIVLEKPEKKAIELEKIFKELYERDVESKINKNLKYLSTVHAKELINLISSSASPVSPTSIAKRFMRGLTRTGIDEVIVTKEINDILSILEDCFLLKHIFIDDYEKRTPLDNIGLNKKYYFTDNGLRYINCLDLSKAMGNCLENAVFIDLSIRGIAPTGYLMLGEKNDIVGEIDFDYMFGNKRFFLQVTHTINEKDYKREIENLKDLPSSFIKQVIYMNNITGKEEEGITYLRGKEFFTK